MSVDELVKAYRDLHARQRQRVGPRTVKSYANAGIEAMATNRSAAASSKFISELTALKKQITGLPGGEELLSALVGEVHLRDRMKAARDAEDGSWERREAALREEGREWSRRVRDQMATVAFETRKATQLVSPKSATQESIEETLETLAQAAKHVFTERPTYDALYLGPGVHEGRESCWEVYAPDADRTHVGRIEVRWPKEVKGKLYFEGWLFSPLGCTFTVHDLVLETVLVHLGIERGRRRERGLIG